MQIKNLQEYKLKSKEISKIDKILKNYTGKKGVLIPVLQEIQKAIGFIPVKIQKKVAVTLGIPEKEVYGVSTFYSFFSMIPRGKNNIRVCLGTACFVKGGKKIVNKIVKELRIEPGQTTEDRKYSLQINRCLGACGLAPTVVINEKIHKKVNPKEVMELIYSSK